MRDPAPRDWYSQATALLDKTVDRVLWVSKYAFIPGMIVLAIVTEPKADSVLQYLVPF